MTRAVAGVTLFAHYKYTHRGSLERAIERARGEETRTRDTQLLQLDAGETLAVVQAKRKSIFRRRMAAGVGYAARSIGDPSIDRWLDAVAGVAR